VATRLYGVANTAAPVSPAFDSGWLSTTGSVRRGMSLTKAATTETVAGQAIASGAGNNALAFQLVSDPLDAQTITGGTVTVIMRGRELATTDNVNKRWRKVYVVSNDGSTVRGTLVSMAASASTTELGTSPAGTVMALNAGTGTLAVSAGDRIVVEVGYGLSSTGTTPQADMVIGGNGTDHTTTEGDTTGTVPWVEFSQNLTFQTLPVTGAANLTASASLSTSGTAVHVVNGITFEEFPFAVNSNTSQDTVTTPSRRFPAGSLGILVLTANGPTNDITATVTDSAGNTWTLIEDQSLTGGQPGIAGAYRQAFASQTDATVSAQITQQTQGIGVKLYIIYSGYDTTIPIGASAPGSSTSATIATASITPQTTGLLIAGASDWTAPATMNSSDLNEETWTISGQSSGSAGYEAGSAGVSNSASWVTPDASQANTVIFEVRSAGGGTTQNGAAALTAGASLTAAGTISKVGVAPLTASASLSTTAFLDQRAAASLTASASLSVPGVISKLGAADLTASAQLVVAGIVTRLGTAALTATAALAAAGVVSKVASAALAASSNLTAAGTVTGSSTASADLSASAALAVSGVVTKLATVSLSATAVLAVPGIVTKLGAADLAAVATFSATATRTVLGLAPIVASSTLTISGAVAGQTGADLVATAALVTGGQRAAIAAASLTAGSTLAVAGLRIALSAASLSASSSLSVSGVVTVLGLAQLVAGSTLIVSGTVAGQTGADLIAVATLFTAGVRTAAGSAQLAAVAILAASGTLSRPGAVALLAAASLTAAGRLDARGSAALIAHGVLSASSFPIVNGAAALIAASLLGTSGTVHTPLYVGSAHVSLSKTGSTLVTARALGVSRASVSFPGSATVRVRKGAT
jgi:hypothetical protein